MSGPCVLQSKQTKKCIAKKPRHVLPANMFFVRTCLHIVWSDCKRLPWHNVLFPNVSTSFGVSCALPTSAHMIGLVCCEHQFFFKTSPRNVKLQLPFDSCINCFDIKKYCTEDFALPSFIVARGQYWCQIIWQVPLPHFLSRRSRGACDLPSAPPSHLDFSGIHPQWQAGIFTTMPSLHCVLSTSLDNTSPSSTMLPALVSKKFNAGPSILCIPPPPSHHHHFTTV